MQEVIFTVILQYFILLTVPAESYKSKRLLTKMIIATMKFRVELLYLLCILKAQSFAVGETKSPNGDISKEIYYTRFEIQLEQLNLQAKINHEIQLREQKELLSKMNELSLQMKGIEAKLLEKPEAERQVPLFTPQDIENIFVMTDIRKKLNEHDSMLAKILNNQKDTQELCKKIDLEDHTQTLKNTISGKMIALQKIDTKITDIENNLMPKNISREIINNQKNIQNFLKEMNLEGHTQALKTIISDKFDLMRKIDERLTIIDNNLIPKNDQLKFYQDIQQQLNATEKYLKGEHHGLIGNETYPTSCADVNANYCVLNMCLIKNHLYGPAPFYVACNSSVDGGGWTVIQRRINGAEDFYREWSEYKDGFGNTEGEFFIGLDKLHALTSTLKPVELLIQLQDFDNVLKYAKYDDFQVGNETENYKLLKVGSYVGNAGDSFSQHVGYNFSTKDRDNDIAPKANCAEIMTSAWWYESCYYCNLNGKYYQDPANASHENGITWGEFHGVKYSLKFVQMLIRPKKL